MPFSYHSILNQFKLQSILTCCMIPQSLKIKEIQSINLSAGIVSISVCLQFIAAGTLDDSIRIWKNSFSPFFDKQPFLHHNQSISGISDIAFKKNSTHFASLSIDSSIKIWDLDTKTMKSFSTPMFSAWKMAFVGDTLVSCGDLGKLFFYDIFSREIVRRVNLEDAFFLTTIKGSHNDKKIAVGAANGNVYILNSQGIQQSSLKPHYKTIRQILFSEDSEKIFTCSDDTMVALSDISNGKVIQLFEGHKQKVYSIRKSQSNSNILYSGSLDKTIKVWDIRTKKNIQTYPTAGPIWCMDVAGQKLLAGGELGILQILAFQ